MSSQPLIPVVVSTFGVLNAAAVTYLEAVEDSARAKGRPYVADPAGPQSLCQLVSLAAILDVATIVLLAHTQGGAHEADGPAAGGAVAVFQDHGA